MSAASTTPQRGAAVRVFPHGAPDQSALAAVILISGNGRSIAVAFDSLPPFVLARAGGFNVHPEHGIVMLAYREAVGPWVELFGGGHFEIELEQTANYQSHRWKTHRENTPNGLDVHVYCERCGCENRGNPGEFDGLEYPACDESA